MWVMLSTHATRLTFIEHGYSAMLDRQRDRRSFAVVERLAVGAVDQGRVGFSRHSLQRHPFDKAGGNERVELRSIIMTEARADLQFDGRVIRNNDAPFDQFNDTARLATGIEANDNTRISD